LLTRRSCTGRMEVAQLLAQADADAREPLTRENDADPLAGEQTWPTAQVPCALQPATVLPSQQPSAFEGRQLCEQFCFAGDTRLQILDAR